MRGTKALTKETSKLESLIANRNIRNNPEIQVQNHNSELREIRESIEQILPWVERELKQIREQLKSKNVDEISFQKINEKILKLTQEIENNSSFNDERYNEVVKSINSLNVTSNKLSSSLGTIQEEIMNYEDEDNTALLNTIQNQKKDISGIKTSIMSLETNFSENSRKNIEIENYVKKELTAVKLSIDDLNSQERIDINPLKRDILFLKNSLNSINDQIKNDEYRIENEQIKREVQSLKGQNTVISENLRISVNELTNTLTQTEETVRNLISKEIRSLKKEINENNENIENTNSEKITEIKSKLERLEKNQNKSNEDQNNRNYTEIQIIKSEIKSINNLLDRSKLSEKNIDNRVLELLRENTIQTEPNKENKEIRELKRLLSNLNEEKNDIIARLDELCSTGFQNKQEFHPNLTEIRVDDNENLLRIEETKKQLKELIETRTRFLENQIKESNNRSQLEKIESKLLRNTQQLDELLSNTDYENLKVRINFLERHIINQPNQPEIFEEKECDKEHPRDQFKKLQKEVRELTCRFNNIENLEKKVKKLECEFIEISSKMVTKCELEKLLKALSLEFDEKLRETNERISLLESEFTDKINFLSKETERNKKLILLLETNMKELAKSTKESIDDINSKIETINAVLSILKGEIRDIKGQLEKIYGQLDEQEGKIDLLNKEMDRNFLFLKRLIEDSIKQQEAFEILINKRIENINDKLIEQNEKFILIEKTIENQNLKIIEINKKLNNIEKTIEDLNIISINSEIEKIKQELIKIHVKNERQDESICNLERRVDALEFKVTAITQALARTDDKLIQIEKQFDRFQDLTIEEFKNIQEKLKEIDSQFLEFKKEYDIDKAETIAKFILINERFDKIDLKLLSNEQKLTLIQEEVDRILIQLSLYNKNFDELKLDIIKQNDENIAKFIIINTKIDFIEKELNKIEKEICHISKVTGKNSEKISEIEGKMEMICCSLCFLEKQIDELKSLTHLNVEEILKLKVALEQNIQEIIKLKTLTDENTEQIIKIQILTNENTENIVKLNILINTLEEKNTEEILKLKLLIEANEEKIDRLKIIVDRNTEEIENLKLMIKANQDEILTLKALVLLNTEEIKNIKKQLECFSCYIDKQEKFKKQVLCRLENLEAKCCQHECPNEVDLKISSSCSGEGSFVTLKNSENDVSLAIFPGFNADTKKIDVKTISIFSNSKKAKLIFSNKIICPEVQSLCIKSENAEIEKINGKNISEFMLVKKCKDIHVTANNDYIIETGFKINSLNVFLRDWIVPQSYETYIWTQHSDTEIKIKCGNTIGKINGVNVSQGEYLLKWF